MNIKNYTFVLLLLGIGLSTSSFAQGIRFGWQNSGTFNNGNIVDEPLHTFYIGINHTHYAREDKKIIGINAGFEYMEGGHRLNKDNFRKIHYLSIPLALRLKLGPVFIQSGFNANLNVAEKYQVNGADSLSDNNKSSRFDLPIQFGAGVIIGIFTVEARYHIGFMDVNNGNKNAYLQLGCSIRFGEE